MSGQEFADAVGQPDTSLGACCSLVTRCSGMLPVPPPATPWLQQSAAQPLSPPRGFTADVTAQHTQYRKGGDLQQTTMLLPAAGGSLGRHSAADGRKCAGSTLLSSALSSLLPLAGSPPVGLGDAVDKKGGGCSGDKAADGQLQPQNPLTETFCSWHRGLDGASCSYNNPLHRPGVGARMVSDRRARPPPYRVLRTNTDSSTSRLIDRVTSSCELQVVGCSTLSSGTHQHRAEADEIRATMTWWPLCVACMFVALLVAVLLLVPFPRALATDAGEKDYGLDTRAAEAYVAEKPGPNR